MSTATRTGGSARSSLDTRLLDLLHCRSDDDTFTTALRNRALQDACDEMEDLAGGRTEAVSLGTLTASQATYPLPIQSLDVVAVWTVIDGVQTLLEAATEADLDRRFPGWQTAPPASVPSYWYLSGDCTVGVYPAPSATGGILYGRGLRLYDAFTSGGDPADAPRTYDHGIACKAALRCYAIAGKAEARPGTFQVWQGEWTLAVERRQRHRQRTQAAARREQSRAKRRRH